MLNGQIANIIQPVLTAGARAVGLDIYRDIPVGDGRAALAEVLSDPRVVTISRLSFEEGGKTGFADIPIDYDGVTHRALVRVNTKDGIELSFPMQLAMMFKGQTSL